MYARYTAAKEAGNVLGQRYMSKSKRVFDNDCECSR